MTCRNPIFDAVADMARRARIETGLAAARAQLCSRKDSAWATPVCEECRGVGHDEDDGSECPECEGDGRGFFNADRAMDRALVSLDFVDAHGPLVAMSAVGFHVGIDSEKREEIEAARAEWATVYRDAFGSSPDVRVSVGMTGVTTLAQAMRDAVAESAVLLRGAPAQREVAMVEVATVKGDEEAAA